METKRKEIEKINEKRLLKKIARLKEKKDEKVEDTIIKSRKVV